MTQIAELKLRTAQRRDLPRLREIIAEAFKGVSIDQGVEQRFGIVGNVGWQARKAATVEIDFAREPQGMIVAGINNVIVGFIASWHDREMSA